MIYIINKHVTSQDHLTLRLFSRTEWVPKMAAKMSGGRRTPRFVLPIEARRRWEEAKAYQTVPIDCDIYAPDGPSFADQVRLHRRALTPHIPHPSMDAGGRRRSFGAVDWV